MKKTIPSLNAVQLTIKTNNMKYFKECRTLDEVKAMYKQLAKQYHPDLGGDTETMQAINSEYAFACAKVLKGENLSSKKSLDEIREKYGSEKVNSKYHNKGIE